MRATALLGAAFGLPATVLLGAASGLPAVGPDARRTRATTTFGVAPLLLLGLAIGCGSDPKPPPQTATVSTTPGVKKADDSAMPPPNSPTASAISIDDA